jgi:translocation and assembly module TamA
MDAKVFQIGSNVIARYRIPVLDPRTDELTLFAEYRDDDPVTSFSRIGRFGTVLSTRWRRSRLDYSLVYHIEDFEVADNDDVVNMLIPGIAVSYISSRDPVHVRHGFRLDASLQGAAEKVLSEISFAQLHLRGKFILSPWRRGRFLARGELGTTVTPELQELPASLRYFAGGDQSVRGYPYKSLGPVNADGEVTGGRYLLVGSLEYEHALNDKWAVAAFIDAGNAFDELDEPHFEQGAGVGIRWRSPVGPVRVDLANAISDPDRGWRLHISIGPDL